MSPALSTHRTCQPNICKPTGLKLAQATNSSHLEVYHRVAPFPDTSPRCVPLSFLGRPRPSDHAAFGHRPASGRRRWLRRSGWSQRHCRCYGLAGLISPLTCGETPSNTQVSQRAALPVTQLVAATQVSTCSSTSPTTAALMRC